MQAIVAIAAVGVSALIARALDFDTPGPIDWEVRHLVRSTPLRRVGPRLAPLFPVGLPLGYCTIALLTARWLRRRRRQGGPAIVSSAVLGWFAQRVMKAASPRERPRSPGVKRRVDSYPSGHTTGVTAVALTTAYVLARQDLISKRRALALAAVAPAIMGAYRVLDDEHWATDVAGGWLLGGAVALACNAILADSLGREDEQRTRVSASSTPTGPRRVRPARSTSAG
jgi:membrane-associated phospholipid phosphatase